MGLDCGASSDSKDFCKLVLIASIVYHRPAAIYPIAFNKAFVTLQAITPVCKINVYI